MNIIAFARWRLQALPDLTELEDVAVAVGVRGGDDELPAVCTVAATNNRLHHLPGALFTLLLLIEYVFIAVMLMTRRLFAALRSQHLAAAPGGL